MKARLVLSMLFLLGLSVRPAAAQSVVPSSFAGWNASGAVARVSPSQLEQFSSEHAAVLREYGMIGAERANFLQGTQTATVTLYNMVDPSAAYGGFTFLRDQQMAVLDLGPTAAFAAGSRDRALIVAGNLLLDIASPSARPSDSELTQLILTIAPHADTRPFPNIASFLPQDGLIHGSERYLLGPKATAQVFPVTPAQIDWIGFDKSAEAVVAHYRLNGQSKDALLLVATYPTQQIAADQYGSLGKWFALNADADAAKGRPVIFGTRQSALVSLIAGADSRESAAALLNQVHFSSAVTWNEPSYEIKDPTIATIVVGAITYTGLIMLIALAAGLGFGGFRLFVKFLFPGRVFDRNEDVEILQLGLGSKPINSEDFYS